MEFNFTQQQMEKFIDAVGGTGEAEAGVHTLQQLHDLVTRSGGLRDFPKITDDAHVNHAVDCVVDPDEAVPYDEKLYLAEIAAYTNAA